MVTVKLDVEEAAMWLELAACVARLPAARLITRLRNGDASLADAVHAVIAAERSPSERLCAVRNFLVMQSLGETGDPTTDVQELRWRPDTSPFNVPQRFLDVWFSLSQEHALDAYCAPMVAVPAEKLMRVRQFYDSLDLTSELPKSTHLFNNRNLGDTHRTNLQASEQLTVDDTLFLVTAWWITTASWPRINEFLAKTWLTMVVGDRLEATIPGLELLHRQTLLIPVPPRQSFKIRFDRIDIPSDLYPLHAPPLYVFIEGWGQRPLR